MTEEFQVNSYTPGIQRNAAVTGLVDGDFVVVWGSVGSFGSDSSGDSIQGQRYDGTGSAVGEQFQVNAHTPEDQESPAVAALADGGFVVVWHSDRSPGSDRRFGRRSGGDRRVRRFRIPG